jgi:hypothetical protein
VDSRPEARVRGEATGGEGSRQGEARAPDEARIIGEGSRRDDGSTRGKARRGEDSR